MAEAGFRETEGMGVHPGTGWPQQEAVSLKEKREPEKQLYERVT